MKIFKRLRYLIGKYGVFGLIRHVFTNKLPALCLKLYRRVFQHKNIVYRYLPNTEKCKAKVEFELERYERMGELSDQRLRHLLEQQGKRGIDYMPLMTREFEDHGVLWLAVVDDQVAGVYWTRKGKHIRKWFVPLRDEDIILFTGVVFTEWRGQRIGPAMMHEMIARETTDGGDAYVDIAIWNKPANTAAPRGGFEQVTVARPLPPTHA